MGRAAILVSRVNRPLRLYPHRIFLRHFVYLENRGFERTDIMENLIIPGIDTIEPQAETYHLQMTPGKCSIPALLQIWRKIL